MQWPICSLNKYHFNNKHSMINWSSTFGLTWTTTLFIQNWITGCMLYIFIFNHLYTQGEEPFIKSIRVTLVDTLKIYKNTNIRENTNSSATERRYFISAFYCIGMSVQPLLFVISSLNCCKPYRTLFVTSWYLHHYWTWGVASNSW